MPELPQQGPEDPGPFAFASEPRVRRILDAAGFTGVGMEARPLLLDAAIGRGLDRAVQGALEIGPVSRALDGKPEEVRAAAANEIREALTPFAKGQACRCRHRFGWSRRGRRSATGAVSRNTVIACDKREAFAQGSDAPDDRHPRRNPSIRVRGGMDCFASLVVELRSRSTRWLAIDVNALRQIIARCKMVCTAFSISWRLTHSN